MTQPRRQLTLLDSTSLVVGIIIGAGIYQMAPDIAKGADNPWALIGLWILGGALSLCGALCYAELATTYPQAGGDYVYLSRAYGSWAGFLFGWAQLAIVRPGDIAVMAFAFATYATTLLDPSGGTAVPFAQPLYAAAAAIVLTIINVLGIRQGKWTQNLLTAAKAVGLLFIAGAAWAAPPAASNPSPTAGSLPASLALIFVLFTYGGWNEMAYVAAEVRDPQRNILRALVIGTATVTALYLLANLAFLRALGFDGVQRSQAVATDTVARVLPNLAPRIVAALICISALGATNGLILTGARISYAVGRDHPWFRPLGFWHPRRGTPANALWLQGGMAVALILALGSFLNAVLYTAAVVYSFYAASTLAVLVLRRKDPNQPRPFRVPGAPLTPLLFAAVCLFLIQSAVVYKPIVAAAGLSLLLLGLGVWRAQHGRVPRRPGAPG